MRAARMLLFAAAVGLAGCGTAYVARLVPNPDGPEALMEETARVEIDDDRVRIEFEVDDDAPAGVVSACFLGDLDPRDQARFLGRWGVALGRETVPRVGLSPAALRGVVRPDDAQSRRLVLSVDRVAFDRLQAQPLVVQYAPTPAVETVGCPSASTPDSLVRVFDVDLALGRPSRVRPVEASSASFLGSMATVRPVADSLEFVIPVRRAAGDETVVGCLASRLSDSERSHLQRRWFPTSRDSIQPSPSPVPMYVEERTVLGERSLRFRIPVDSTSLLDAGLVATPLAFDGPSFVPDCTLASFQGDYTAIPLDLQEESRAGHAAGGVGLVLFLVLLGVS